MVKKTFNPAENTCKVTFVLPADIKAEAATLCGDFNSWDKSTNPMKKQKDGSFKLSLTLETGRQYAYRYLLAGDQWENDWQADAYLPNDFGTENSVIYL
jgi:1,4-alpha-glucan branching enzyme